MEETRAAILGGSLAAVRARWLAAEDAPRPAAG
jgi:hypothetical protein